MCKEIHSEIPISLCVTLLKSNEAVISNFFFDTSEHYAYAYVVIFMTRIIQKKNGLKALMREIFSESC